MEDVTCNANLQEELTAVIYSLLLQFLKKAAKFVMVHVGGDPDPSPGGWL